MLLFVIGIYNIPFLTNVFCSDLDDGGFLVPKIVLTATHYPGKQLVDDEGQSGQIDGLYDAACDAAG